jgi:hypothetical protein
MSRHTCRSTEQVTESLFGTSVVRYKDGVCQYETALTVGTTTHKLGTTYWPRCQAGAAIAAVTRHMEANGGQHPPPQLRVNFPIDSNGTPAKDPQFYLNKIKKGTLFFKTVTEAMTYYRRQNKGWVPPANATKEQLAEPSIRAGQCLEIWDMYLNNKELPDHATK